MHLLGYAAYGGACVSRQNPGVGDARVEIQIHDGVVPKRRHKDGLTCQ